MPEIRFVGHRLALCLAVWAMNGCASNPSNPPGNSRALAVAEQGYFFAGGKYVNNKAGQQIRVGQMFVQYQIPARKTQPYPVVMWHGGGQTGTNFLGTPDGRKGWADHFLQHGYSVYVVDQPARARSGYFAEVYGKARNPNAQAMADRFTAPARAKQYPQANQHTQWPGTGVPGDPTFDQFFSSQVEDIADVGVIEQLTHSQSGPFGWALANDRPKLVKGILAVEPNGPPLYENAFAPAPDYFKDGPLGRPWGITRGPLRFQPPAATAADLKLVRQTAPDGPDLVRCWVQPAPVRQLPHLQGLPILIVTSEASYHAPYDHCTAKFLTQAGVTNTFVRLPDIGIHGNGHMMMLEKNNLEIAGFLIKWARNNIR
jgi:pimeloyl-ACP methyl ester carboxylesterase